MWGFRTDGDASMKARMAVATRSGASVWRVRGDVECEGLLRLWQPGTAQTVSDTRIRKDAESVAT